PRGFETAHRAAQTGAPVPYFTYPPTLRETQGGSLHRRDPHLRVLRDGPGGDHVPEAELTEGVECPGLRERGQLGTGDPQAFTPARGGGHDHTGGEVGHRGERSASGALGDDTG